MSNYPLAPDQGLEGSPSVSAIGSFFKSFLGERLTPEAEAVKKRLIEDAAQKEGERRALTRKSLPDLVCAYPAIFGELLRSPRLSQDAIVVLGDLSDDCKRAFAEKSGVRILEMLNSDANPALRAAIIDLIFALPDGLMGRIRSLFSGRRTQSKPEENLRRRVESEVVDGFSLLPKWAATSFISGNADVFISLLDSSHREVMATASIILAAAPAEVRDDFVACHAKQLFHAVAFAPLISGLTSFVLNFFPGEGQGAREYATACAAAVQSTKLVLEWLPRLSPRAKEAIFAGAFNEFYLLVASFVGDLKPDLWVRRTQAIMDGMRVAGPLSTATCNALVCGEESPLAVLLRAAAGKDGAPTVVAHTMLPYVGDFLRQASQDARYSFAIQNPEVFFPAFSPMGGELAMCCMVILQTMSEADRRAFIVENGNLFVRFVLCSDRPEIRSAAVRLLADWKESFAVANGVTLVEALVACENRETRESILRLIQPFGDRFTIQHGNEVIEALIGASDPDLRNSGLRLIEPLGEISLREFFLAHGDVFLAHLGRMDGKKAPLAQRMLDLVKRVPGAITPEVAADGLMHCCLSRLPFVRDFGRPLFQECAPDVRVKALEACLAALVGSILCEGPMDQLCSLVPSLSFEMINSSLKKNRLDPKNKLWDTRKIDSGVLSAELATFCGPKEQCGVLNGELEVSGIFALGLMTAIASQALGSSDALVSFFIPLLGAFAPSAREEILRATLKSWDLSCNSAEKPCWEVLRELWANGVDRRYFDRVFAAAGAPWNAILAGLPSDLVAYLTVPTST